MSQKQFDRFYWPPLKKLIEAFIKEGLIISIFAEGSYNSRLDSVNEFPKARSTGGLTGPTLSRPKRYWATVAASPAMYLHHCF